MNMNILEVQNLCKTYGKGEAEVRALDHVSFSIEGDFRSPSHALRVGWEMPSFSAASVIFNLLICLAVLNCLGICCPPLFFYNPLSTRFPLTDYDPFFLQKFANPCHGFSRNITLFGDTLRGYGRIFCDQGQYFFFCFGQCYFLIRDIRDTIRDIGDICIIVYNAVSASILLKKMWVDQESGAE